MKKVKKGNFNFVLFWIIFLFILLVLAVWVLFFTEIFKSGKNNIQQVNLGEPNVTLKILDFKTRRAGVDFVLDINPKRQEILGIKFTFKTKENKTEVYTIEGSYKKRVSENYSIDLKTIFSNDIESVLIEPTINQSFFGPPQILKEMNDSMLESESFIRKIISKKGN